MKPTPNEREILALQLCLTRAKLRLNTARLAYARRADMVSPAALLTATIRSRQAWRWLTLPVNTYLKLALAATYWLSRSLHTKK